MIKILRGIRTLILSLFFIFVVVEDGHTSSRCVECHEGMEADHTASVHREVPCLKCHVQATEEDHGQTVFAPVNCRQCHHLHDEKILHDPHIRVSCKACHIKGGIPEIDPESKKIIFKEIFNSNMASLPHQSIQSMTEEQCETCHFQGNTMGVSAIVLPAKSILCMPCHVASFSVNDITTLVSLFIFLLGMAGLFKIWCSGSIHRQWHRSGRKIGPKSQFKPRAFLSDKPFQFFKMVFFEVILLRRLFQQSRPIWIIHSLIFFPLCFRFAFGLTALLFSIFLPDWSVTLAMLDKNHAVRALSFDVTGLIILSGVLALIARQRKDTGRAIPSLPEPGRGVPIIIGLILVAGFILEGLRIAMTGWPPGSGWAFWGYGISLMFKGMTGLTDVYGYVWYVHAVLTGVFIAMIPFTRMIHIIMAPLVLILNARFQSEKDL